MQTSPLHRQHSRKPTGSEISPRFATRPPVPPASGSCLQTLGPLRFRPGDRRSLGLHHSVILGSCRLRGAASVLGSKSPARAGTYSVPALRAVTQHGGSLTSRRYSHVSGRRPRARHSRPVSSAYKVEREAVKMRYVAHNLFHRLSKAFRDPFNFSKRFSIS